MVQQIHKGWFETTFPGEAGQLRYTVVIASRARVGPVGDLGPAVHRACDDYRYQMAGIGNTSRDELAFQEIEIVNKLVATIYDVHPFIDGNTRTSFSLRDYALQALGHPSLGDVHTNARYMQAWGGSRPLDHGFLDEVTFEVLADVERERAEANRRF